MTGIIGAAVGSRDLANLGHQYRLSVRADRTNPTAEDFQRLGSLPPAATATADRHRRIGTAINKAFPSNRSGGSLANEISRKDYLAHSEFIVAVEAEQTVAEAWFAALRKPVFMTYLGRKSCPPTFPFILGVWNGDPADLFAGMPSAMPPSSREAELVAPGWLVGGDYNEHVTTPIGPFRVPVTDREGQLAWVSQQLSR